MQSWRITDNHDHRSCGCLPEEPKAGRIPRVLHEARIHFLPPTSSVGPDRYFIGISALFRMYDVRQLRKHQLAAHLRTPPKAASMFSILYTPRSPWKTGDKAG